MLCAISTGGADEKTAKVTTAKLRVELNKKIDDLRAIMQKKDVNLFNNEKLKKLPGHQKLINAFKESFQALVDEQIAK